MRTDVRSSELSSRQGLQYMPGLDGLRGVAVLAVIFFHAGFGWAVGGWLGVSLFFTLSGYLITSVTLAEFEQTGTVSLVGFWERRVRRLLPASLITLGGVAVLSRSLVFDQQLDALRTDIISALLYVANWRFWERGESYADVFGAPSPVVHFWSLSIEEQFYILFPILALATLARGGVRTLRLTVALLAAASLIAGLVIAGADRSYYGTDIRAFEILVGVLLALWHRSGGRTVPAGERTAALAAWPALVIMGWEIVNVTTSSPATSTWLLPCFAGLSAIVILAASQPQTALAQLFTNRVLVAIGKISYGVYLYHWPVFGLLNAQRTDQTGWPLFALRFAVTLAVAFASFHLIERPVRQRAAFATRPALLRAMVASAAAVVAVTVIWVATPDRPVIDLAATAPEDPPASTTSEAQPAKDPADEPQAAGTDEPAATTPLPFPEPVRILTFGDSTAKSAGEGLQQWGEASGSAIVSIWHASGCGVIDAGAFRHQPGPGDLVPDYCRNWREHVPPRIESFDPDIIVVFFGPFDTVDRDVDLDGNWESPGDPVHDGVYAEHFAAKLDLLAADSTPVVWMAPPYVWADSPRGSGNRSLTTQPERVDALTALLERLTDADDRVTLVPYGRFVDNGDTEVDFDQRYDGVHFAEGVAAELARDGLLDLILQGATTQVASTATTQAGSIADE